MTVFGTILTGGAIEDAVVSLLKLWLPTYLAELERVTGRDPQSLPGPRSYLITNRVADRRPQDQLPACVVVSPGIVGQPVRRGDGTIDAVFRIEVGVMVSAATRDQTNRIAKVYAAAVRSLLVQKQVPGTSGRATFLGESYEALPANILDVGALAIVVLDVPVSGLNQTEGGPTAPNLAPGEWPDVETTHVQINRGSLV